MQPRPTIWTVGHSNHELERFFALVFGEQIEYLVDVRSYPYSRVAPHFNRETLQPAVEERGIRYVFLGLTLGGRPQRDEHYDADGYALYAEMAVEPSFQQAIGRLLNGARKHRLALLCGCGRPDSCHRRLLVGKVLCERGAELRHILTDGTIRIEDAVSLPRQDDQAALFGHDIQQWRSAQSVSHRRRLRASSAG